MLFRKLLRTAWRYKAQFLSMVIMIALGVGVFTGFNMEWVSIEENTAYAFGETGFADYRLVSETGFSEAELEKVLAIDGVEDAARYLALNATVKGDTDVIALTVSENIRVSGFLVTEGEAYDETATDRIWLSDQYAARNGVSLGDRLMLTYRDLEVTGTVAGLIKSGEYLICVPDESQLMPDFDSFGFAYITPTMLENALGAPFYTQINVLSGMEKKEFTRLADEALGRTTLALSKDETVSYAEAMGESEEGKTMGSILPVLFIAIAVLTMVTTMHRVTANEKTQIGALKALGFKDRRILVHYTSYALLIGVVGTALGIAIGFGLARFIMSPEGAMGTYLDMPTWDLGMPGFCWAVMALVIVLLVFIGWLSVKKMLRGTAADALRPYASKKMRKLALERTRLWDRFSFGTRWNLRDIMRHKSRSLMTLIGIVGCMVLLIGAFGMRDTMDAFVGIFFDDALPYSMRINVADTASNEDALALAEKYDGDWCAASSVEVGEKAVGLEIYHVVRDLVRFVTLDMEFVTLQDGGVYLCERIAEENGLSAGDTVRFSPYGSDKTYEAEVLGILRSMTESIVMTDTAAEALDYPYRIGQIFTDAGEVAAEAAVGSAQSKQSITDSFDSFMEVMDSMIFLLILAAVILGLVVLYNLGVMSYVERYREMATLKVVGFKDGRIGRLLIGQNLWITVLGVVVGVPAGIGVLQYLISALASEYEMQLALGPLTFVGSVVLTFGVSLLVSVIIARKNRRIDMVEALKGAE